MNERPSKIGETDLPLLRNRQPQVVERWFLEHADAVYTFVFYRVGKDEELATDVVQETFAKALRKIEQYDPRRGAMLAWLTYLARNCIRAALKQKGRYQTYAEFWDGLDRKLVAAYRELATAPLPEEVLEQRETAELVQIAMANIPSHYQRALTQRYYQQQALEEIARAEGMTPGAVKGLLHRARLAFKTAFQAFVETLDQPCPAGETVL